MQEFCATGGRRRWSLDDKRAAVELSLDPAGGVTAVAACLGVSSTQIYAWRREVRELAELEARRNEPLFMSAVVEEEPPAMMAAVIEVGCVPVGIARGANSDLIASVVALLEKMR